ncbi:hypothetical protein RHAB21_03499 [Pseudorhizobium halotolerans]|uniref:Uncharacterized protein n=1 Tax=Pseudorhizobium halotolerans TaxID=1233081 RepID=A0ABN7JV89_9HYPH|nr:hypothetical protein RHAB21_03499 [Pseudorhizobium halotolerans]
MAARLIHQTGADPVELAKEMRPLLKHGRPLKPRTTAGNKADRVSAGMTVDAGEGIGSHRFQLRRKA